MSNSPFKFLDAYTLEDRDIFFGRDDEIARLYEMVFQSNLVMVYGPSGTGKTSLVQCGLAGRFASTDWLSLFVRRGRDINAALRTAIKAATITEVEAGASLNEQLQNLFLDHFKPIYLIFDQFEELFILGSPGEREVFYHDIQELYKAGLNCKLLFVLREEYLGQLYEFEQVLPDLFDKRLRVEPMNRANVSKVISGSCEKFGIDLQPEEDTINAIFDQVSAGKAGVQLTYLQVYLDRLWTEANKND